MDRNICFLTGCFQLKLWTTGINSHENEMFYRWIQRLYIDIYKKLTCCLPNIAVGGSYVKIMSILTFLVSVTVFICFWILMTVMHRPTWTYWRAPILKKYYFDPLFFSTIFLKFEMLLNREKIVCCRTLISI